MSDEERKRRSRGRTVPAQAPWLSGGSQQERAQRLQQLIDDPRTPLRRIDEAYVDMIKPMLVEKAAEFYRQEGRGVIVLDFGDTDLRHMKGGIVPTFYMSENDRQRMGETWPQELKQAIDDYDPEREMLVVAHHTVRPNLFRLKRIDAAA